jgi:aminoglycoside phosphotransferase family enzyme/predicted kinase
MEALDPQAAVIAFLSSPATCGGGPVERISTHGAHIFLAGDRAYKLKRAVKFPFMDFSTVEKRRAALATEFEINRRTAPSLYINLRAVHAPFGGAASFAGDGPVLDWVLTMQRFGQDQLLDAIARRGAFSEAIADSVADVVAAAHAGAPRVDRDEGGYFEAMAVETVSALENTVIPAADVGRLKRHIGPAANAARNYLNARVRDGFVRACHGDLHLHNIVVLDGAPVLFDALEFDRALASGDVYYDLAFLLMDLDHRRLRPIAHRVLNRYAAATDDLAGLAALPLFLATRAAVRAKVAVLTGASAASAEARDRSIQDALDYVDLANGYFTPVEQCLIAVGGLSGTGKSSVAARLAPIIGAAPGAMVFRSDVLRKRLQGVAETTRLSPATYTPAASAEVYRALIDRAACALAAGRSVILDAVFARPQERDIAADLARKHGVAFHGLWLETPLDVRRDRIAARLNDPSDATAAVTGRQELYDLGYMAWRRLDAGHPIEDVAAAALALCG